MNELPFRTLLYRYFFFGWMFREVGPGNLFERAAVRRHNRRQARWLPTYMARWLFLGIVLYAVGDVGEWLLSPVAARCIYALSAACLSFSVTTATAWVGLAHGEEML